MSILSYLSKVFSKRVMTEEQDAIFYAMQNSLDVVKSDIDLFALMQSLATSTDTWLDEWGSYFKVYRLQGEIDADYRTRILNKAMMVKNTIPVMKQTALDYINKYVDATTTSDDIGVLEPHRFIKTFSGEGKFSGVHGYPDNQYWTSGVLEIMLPYEASDGLREAVNNVKPGGVQVYYIINQCYNKEIIKTGGIPSALSFFTSPIYFSLNYDTVPIAYKLSQAKYMVIPVVYESDIYYNNQYWKIVSPSQAMALGCRWVYVDCYFRGSEVPLLPYNNVCVHTGITRKEGVSLGKFVVLPSEVNSTGTLQHKYDVSPTNRREVQKELISIILQF